MLRQVKLLIVLLPLAIGCGAAAPPAKNRAKAVKAVPEAPRAGAKDVAVELIKVQPMTESEVMYATDAALKVIARPWGSRDTYASDEHRARRFAEYRAARQTLHELWPGLSFDLWTLYKMGPAAADALPLVRHWRGTDCDLATATCLALDPTDTKSLEMCIEVIKNAPKIEYENPANDRVRYALWGIAAVGTRAKAGCRRSSRSMRAIVPIRGTLRRMRCAPSIRQRRDVVGRMIEPSGLLAAIAMMTPVKR